MHGAHQVTDFLKSQASAHMHIAVNIFDGEHLECGRALHASGASRVTYVPGFKTLFWKQVLTPNITASYDLIWLLDCDLRITPHLFTISEVEYWLETTGASIIQPSVVPHQHNGRGGRGALTRAGFSADCIARAVPHIEQMTPIFRRASFDVLWKALSRIPDERLGSDSGLETLWCGLAVLHFADWPACIALSHMSVIHLNTHTIHRYDKQERAHYFNQKVNLLPYLNENFSTEMQAARLRATTIARELGNIHTSSKNGTYAETLRKSQVCWGIPAG